MRKRTLVIAAGALIGVYLVRRSRLPIDRRDVAARRFMNERLTPILLRRGAADGSRNGIGIVEHVGRVSGTVRRTLVHPIIVQRQVAIPLPYRDQGQWTKNVLASGCCRLQFRDHVYTLANPTVVNAGLVDGLPGFERWIVRLVGGDCLLLDVESASSGRFEDGAESGAMTTALAR